jgi:hypothetical protein
MISCLPLRLREGFDFPGDTCRSVVFTKYPNPNVKDVFWRILQNTHPDWYWSFIEIRLEESFCRGFTGLLDQRTIMFMLCLLT